MIAGPPCEADLDGVAVESWSTFDVERGQTLRMGRITGGVRAYLLVAGGIDVPPAMGSTATFALGGIGGFSGRALRAGDTVRIRGMTAEPLALDVHKRPEYDAREAIRVIMGPHAAPDFFTEDDVEVFLSAQWTVHYNSSRTGVRLTGPQPTWARPDGGEAGLHPSNIHDTAYAFGSVDFTGDMPVILGPDGPSLGGFVCPAAVINADRWKLGQLAPGDSVRFVPVTEAAAARIEEELDAYVDNLDRFPGTPVAAARQDPVVRRASGSPTDSDFVIRRAGQEWLLVEFGPHVLDIALHLKGARFRGAAQAGSCARYRREHTRHSIVADPL